jgi:hypothetical protein
VGRDGQALDISAVTRSSAHRVAHDPALVAGHLEVDHRRGSEGLVQPGPVEAPERREGGPVDVECRVLLASPAPPQLDARQRHGRHQRVQVVAEQMEALGLGEAGLGERPPIGPVERGGDDGAVALLAQALDRVLDVGRREGPEVVGREGEVRDAGVGLPRPHAQPRADADGRTHGHCLRE